MPADPRRSVTVRPDHLPRLPAHAARPGPDPSTALQLRLEDALFAWKRTEPVRLYVYGLLAAVVVILATVGAVTGELGAALTGLAAALLVGVPGAEAARASVVSPATRAQERLDDSTRYAAMIRASSSITAREGR